LKSVFYPGVSTSLLISYFNDFPVEEIDSDLFNSLKERIFSDVFLSDSFPSSNRWRNPPKSQSKKEVEQIYQMLQNHFSQLPNPVEQLQTLMNENQEMQITIEETKNQLKQKEEEIEQKTKK
jgi:predicted RND superfamily exporter protein